MSDHVLHLGDCLDPILGLASLADKSVDVCLTDPPYDAWTHANRESVVRTDGGPVIGAIPFAALSDVRPAAEQIARVTGRWALVFCAIRQVERWAIAFEAIGWNVRRVAIWVKPDASPQFSGDRPGSGYESIVCAHSPGRSRWNGGGAKGVYECPRIDRESGFLHPTQKPLGLIKALMTDFTDPGELVCDPFAGSGTTAVACKQLSRRFIGWELNGEYHERAVRRLENTKQQYELLPRGPKPKQLYLPKGDSA